MLCPVDKTALAQAGYTQRCATCNGAWIAEETLVALLEQRTDTLVELAWKPRAGDPRPCASCSAAMETVTLGDVQLDRCAAHGVWFDKDELATLLGEAKQFAAPPPERHASLLDALRNVFKR